MKPDFAKKLLRVLMIVVGCGLMVAFCFLIMPGSQMTKIHAWLGLGVFPDEPISWYLARSTCLLYGVHGVLMVQCGLHIDRYFDLIPLFGWLHFFLGIAMICIDLTAGMPWWWTSFEGAPIALTGLFFVWLSGQARQAGAEVKAPIDTSRG